MNENLSIMFEKAKSTPGAETNPQEASTDSKRDQIAINEAELRYDQDDDDTADGSTEETARYIADMVGALAAMAGGARLDLLTYLLNMARVEAELQARQSETPED